MHHYLQKTVKHITLAATGFQKFTFVFIGLLLLPLAFSSYVIDASNVPVFTGISLLLLAVVFYVYRNKPILQIPAFVSSALLIYFFTNLASCARALNTADAIYESFRVFMAAALIFLFYVLFENKTLQRKTFQLLVFGGLLVVAIAAWQHFSGVQIINSVLGHKNLLASFLLLSLTFAIYLLFDSHKKLKVLSVLIALFFLIALLLLRVRSTYLAVLVGVLCFAISHAWYSKKLTRTIIFSFVVLTALLLLPLFPGFERFDIISFKGSDSGVERIKIWRKTWQLFLEHPVFGVGAGNWQYLYQKFGVGDLEAVRNSGITFQRPHNDFLWILSETGLVGFLLVLSVIVYTGVRYHKTQLQKPNPRTMVLFSGLAALLVDAFFSLDKERPLLIFYAAVLFAALLRQILVPLELQKTTRTIVLFGICILLCFGILVSAYRISGEYHTQQLLISKNNNDLTQMSIQGRKALSPFYTCDPTSTPITSYIGYAYERMNRADSMLVYTEQAYQLAPYDYEVLNNYGMMIARAGQLEKAETLLKEAYRINPYFEVTRLNLAVTAFNRKKFTEAKQWLSTIPNYQKQYPVQTAAILGSKN